MFKIYEKLCICFDNSVVLISIKNVGTSNTGMPKFNYKQTPYVTATCLSSNFETYYRYVIDVRVSLIDTTTTLFTTNTIIIHIS